MSFVIAVVEAGHLEWEEEGYEVESILDYAKEEVGARPLAHWRRVHTESVWLGAVGCSRQFWRSRQIWWSSPNYSALPNKRNGTLIIFCKIGNAVRSLLGAVW